MTVMSTAPENTEYYLGQIEEFQKENSESHLVLRRDAGLKRFKSLGFPNSKNESWKYTPLLDLAKKNFYYENSPLLDRDKIKSCLERERNDYACIITFYNGAYYLAKQNVEISGLEVSEWAGEHTPSGAMGLLRDFSDTSAIYGLNQAFLKQGVVIRVKENTRVDKPILILHLDETTENSTMTHLQNSIVLESNSELKIVEKYMGFGNEESLKTVAFDLCLNPQSSLEWSRIQNTAETTYFFSDISLKQERDTSFTYMELSSGARLARYDFSVQLEGEGAECLLKGVFLGGNDQHIDHQILMEHCKPHGTSEQNFKGLMGGKSTGVFGGKVFVHKDAQKTAAVQSNKNLLLSDTAKVDTQPQLEIYADDVKCAHGATVGQLDKSSVFYLMSRGLSQIQAEDMLSYAFAGELIDSVSNESIKNEMREVLNQKFSKIRHA